jgi:hypothetical protein
MIEQDIDLQLLGEWPDTGDMYVEFNIAEKLQGDFEEQIKALQSAVGRPWMTANEARAKQNMRSLAGDADELVTPLNVMVGGQASPRDADPSTSSGQAGLLGEGVKGRTGEGVKKFDSHAPGLRANHVEKWSEVLSSHYRRQERAIVSRFLKAVSGGHWRGVV